MSYSDTQFQKALLNALNKIADELHKSNKLMDRALKYNEKFVEITKDSNELNEMVIATNIGSFSINDFDKYLEEKIRNNSRFRNEDVKPDEKKGDSL